MSLVVRATTAVSVSLLIALLTFGLLKQAPNTTIDENLARTIATPAPPLDLPVLSAGEPILEGVREGRPLALAALRGRPVVINFWASWCVPCREEAPVLRRAWARSKSSNVVFVGVNELDVRADAADFIARYDLSFPHVRDRGKRAFRAWGVTGLPETFFVDRNGRVVAHVIGVISRSQLQRGIAAARSGRPIDAGGGGNRRAGV